MTVLKQTKKYIKKTISFFKYIISKDIVNMSPNEADLYLQKIAQPHASTPITHNNICDDNLDLLIIVPAYNSEKWIDECVKSIVFQKTDYSYLAIFVDDGSTDNTGKILDIYVNYENIEIIHQKNRGYSGARNVALKNLRSKYIMFVDSDDFLLPDAIQKLMDIAMRHNADVVEGNGYRFNEHGRMDTVKKKSANVEDKFWGAPWMKVMKSSLWENFEFPEGYLYEDTIIGSLIFPLAKSVLFIDDEVYAYRVHSNSITQRHDNNLRRIDSYWIMLLMAQLQEQYNIPKDYSNYRKVMKHIVFTYRRTYLLPEEVKKAIFAGTRGFIEKNFKEFVTVKDKYYLLAMALEKKDYTKYVIFCEELIF